MTSTWRSPPFTDEDRKEIFETLVDQCRAMSPRDMAERLVDSVSLIDCIAYSCPETSDFSLMDLIRMIEHLGSEDPDNYVNGEFLRLHDDDGDDYAGQLDFAKRMGLINQEETELTPLGRQFVGEYGQ